MTFGDCTYIGTKQRLKKGNVYTRNKLVRSMQNHANIRTDPKSLCQGVREPQLTPDFCLSGTASKGKRLCIHFCSQTVLHPMVGHPDPSESCVVNSEMSSLRMPIHTQMLPTSLHRRSQLLEHLFRILPPDTRVGYADSILKT